MVVGPLWAAPKTPARRRARGGSRSAAGWRGALDDEAFPEGAAVVPAPVLVRRERLRGGRRVPLGAVFLQPGVGAAAVELRGGVSPGAAGAPLCAPPCAPPEMTANGSLPPSPAASPPGSPAGAARPKRVRARSAEPPPWAAACRAANRARSWSSRRCSGSSPPAPCRCAGLFHVAHGELRVVRLEGAGEFVREVRDLVRALGAVQRGVEMDALAAAGHRDRLQAHVHQDAAGEFSDLHTFGQAGAVAGVRSSTSRPAAGRCRAGPPATAARGSPRPRSGPAGERGRIVDQRVLDGAFLVGDAARGTQPGVEWSRFFWKNISPGASAVPTPWTQRFRVAGRFAAAGISTGATAA